MLTSASTKLVSPPQAALICVGSELLRGKINTHAALIAQQLAPLGIQLANECTMGDALAPLAEAIRAARQQYPLVIVTGGLGPTFDDLTREAAAWACRRSLQSSATLLKDIRAKFRKARYRRMPPANARQAYLIDDAVPIPNPNGTAPGQWLETRGSVLLLLPGPPRELAPMLSRWVVPRLKQVFRRLPRAEAHLHFVGISESLADHAIRPIVSRFPDVEFTILAHLGLVDLDIFVTARSHGAAQRLCQRITRRVMRKLGRHCYGINDQHPLEKVVGDALTQRKQTVAMAESCTGGMLASRLTDIPGSSAYVVGGVVAYSNAVKEEVLGVPADRLAKEGAVSASVALAMATGVRKKFRTTYGVGITGVAGPSGATPDKPIGLVFIAVSRASKSVVQQVRFAGSRDAVRQRAVTVALDLLRRSLD